MVSPSLAAVEVGRMPHAYVSSLGVSFMSCLCKIMQPHPTSSHCRFHNGVLRTMGLESLHDRWPRSTESHVLWYFFSSGLETLTDLGQKRKDTLPCGLPLM